jgi:putative acetyltransferase
MLPIARATPDELAAALDALATLTVEAVGEGAELGLLAPLDPAKAREFWSEASADPRKSIFLARDEGRVAGTVTLDLATAENRPHAGGIAKLIVGREWRRKGLGEALTKTAIAEAAAQGRTLLCLDVRSGDAAHALYRKLGFRDVGGVPGDTRDARGDEFQTTFLYLDLRPQAVPDLAPYRLRAATDADSARVIAHVAGIWAEYPGCVMDLEEESDLKTVATSYTSSGGSIWVAEHRDGTLAATVAIAPCEAAPGGMQLGRLYVAKSARRGGLASKLLAFAESSARARGASFMELWTDTRFKEAHEFYEARGYVRLPGERALRDASDSYEFHYRKIL